MPTPLLAEDLAVFLVNWDTLSEIIIKNDQTNRQVTPPEEHSAKATLFQVKALLQGLVLVRPQRIRLVSCWINCRTRSCIVMHWLVSYPNKFAHSGMFVLINFERH